MNKVIGIGETIMDIVFHGDHPTAAIPGGSSFNCIISLGRAGIPALFLGETGQDEVGQRIINFLKKNHVDSTSVCMREDLKTAVSLAFLDDKNDAHYSFYKEVLRSEPSYKLPEVTANDILQFGSFYVLNPHIRPFIKTLLSEAKQQGCILYYDINFRRSHLHELPGLLPTIHENYRLSDIVRGSSDDFEIMYGERNPERIYQKHIAPYCPVFICTQGSEGVTVCTPEKTFHYKIAPLQTVSNIGAGDNFNAGFLYGIVRHAISREILPTMTETQWTTLVGYGQCFAANVCMSIHNSIDTAFGEKMKEALKEDTP